MDIRPLLEKQARSHPEKTAFFFRDQPITYQKLRDASFQLAHSLLALGVKKQDKVALYLPTCPEYLYSYLAIWSIGATAVPLDFMLTDDELSSCINHAGARVLIAKERPAVSFSRIKAGCPALEKIVLCQDHQQHSAEQTESLWFEQLVAAQPATAPQVNLNPGDYAIIFYTSGTTGKPKGVLISYRQLEAPPQAMTHFVDFRPDDLSVTALPFSHLGGLIYLQNALFFGLTVVLMERFIPLEFLKNIQKYRVTCFWAVPSMYYAMLQLKEFETFDLSSLRWIVIFGAPSAPDAMRRFNLYCPKAHLLHGWGLTETNAPTCVIPMGSKKIESVGQPPPWVEVKVFDEHAQPLPAGEVGEIVVRGWVVTDGYYKNPEATAEALRNGWFHTGDLGRLDEEGYLSIVGRKKEMIKVAGEIVFEPEVEASLHTHPAVAEAAVIGVPDKLRGEVPKAFVVPKEGVGLTESELRSFLRQHLAHFKIPHYFVFRDSLPKNRVGKLDKEKLRQDVRGNKEA